MFFVVGLKKHKLCIFSRVGRKYSLVFYFLVGGVMCIVAGVTPSHTGNTNQFANTTIRYTFF